MVNTAAQEKFGLMSQIANLSVSQAKACDKMFNQSQSLAFLKLYALEDAQGLSTQQWMKAYRFKKEYDSLVSLTNPKELEALLKTHDKFLAYDSLMQSQISIPNVMKPYDQEILLALAKKLIANPALSLEEVTQDIQDKDPEQISIAMQYALAIDLLKNPKLLHQLREKLWQEGNFKLCSLQKNQAQTKALEELWPKPAPLIKKLSPELFLKFWQAKKHHGVEAQFEFGTNAYWMLDIVQKHLNWTPKEQTSDQWIEEALKLAINAYLNPRIHRDVLALCYDQAVEQLLPVVEAQWRQILMHNSIGQKQVLMFYPHGKSGVMIFLCDEKGEVRDDFTIYPHAPDYNIEDGISQIVKVLTRNPIQNLAWVYQPETKKAIFKILNTIQKRYPDLNWELNLISNRLCPLFTTTEKKAPSLDDVKKAALFIQDPWKFWAKCKAEQLLGPLLRLLPQERLQSLWRYLLQEQLLIKGIHINEASPEVLGIIDDLSTQDIETLIKLREDTPIQSIEQIQNALQKDCHALAAYIRFQPFPYLAQDQAIIDDILQNKNCSITDLFQDFSIIDSIRHTPSIVSKWGEDKIFRLQNLIWNTIQFHKPIHLFQNLAQKQLTEIKPGTRFYGTITKILNYGFFVDLGEGVEGLVHISAIGDCFISDLNLIFQEGDTIVVEWAHFDEKQKRLSLRLHAEVLKKKITEHKHKPLVKKQQAIKSPPKVEKKPLAIGPSAMELAFANLKK
jgi:predicted RNA-binding protein with RPS1 domain